MEISLARTVLGVLGSCVLTFSTILASTEKWSPRHLSTDVAIHKMWKNEKKTIEEHRARTDHPDVYTNLALGLPSLEELSTHCTCSSLQLSYHVAERQGVRKNMEDAHFFGISDFGTIIGVLDGHGGAGVARFAKEQIITNFDSYFVKTNKNIHQTLELLIDDIHGLVSQNPLWDHVGSTAVLCFVDKMTNHIYTATLGDSEASIYRTVQGNLRSIPLSCVRDWSCPSDALRASIALSNPQIALDWPKAPDPKRLRYPSPYYGVNVSRAIGDVALAGTVEKPGIIHKPKITINKLQAGDILILACDGLKDYVCEKEIIPILQKKPIDPAAELADYALHIKHSQDNITILAVFVQ